MNTIHMKDTSKSNYVKQRENLEATQEKRVTLHKGVSMWMTDDFLSEIMEGRRQWKEILNEQKGEKR